MSTGMRVMWWDLWESARSGQVHERVRGDKERTMGRPFNAIETLLSE